MTVPLTAAVLLLWSTWYLFSGHERAPTPLAHIKGSMDGHSRQKAFELHALRAFGFNGLRQKSKRLVDDDTTAGMTDDMA